MISIVELPAETWELGRVDLRLHSFFHCWTTVCGFSTQLYMYIFVAKMGKSHIQSGSSSYNNVILSKSIRYKFHGQIQIRRGISVCQKVCEFYTYTHLFIIIQYSNTVMTDLF